MRKLFCVLLTVGMVLSMVACNDSQKTTSLLSAEWYMGEADEPQFILYDDGTCKISSQYGTGTWSVVNENQLKLTNYYGETQVATISELTEEKLILSNEDGSHVELRREAISE